LGGDLNAEVGGSKDSTLWDVMGRFGNNGKMKAALDLLEFCKWNGLTLASSFYQQTEPSTRWSEVTGVGHELEHVCMHHQNKWLLRQRRTLDRGVYFF
jgi:hypothetical protein